MTPLSGKSWVAPKCHKCGQPHPLMYLHGHLWLCRTCREIRA